jgi:hypothetical protein
MWRRVALVCVLFAFLLNCGGHWYVLQGVAWVNMIRDYSQMVPLAQAVAMTISGKYPCPMCKAIAEERQTENAKFCSFSKELKKISACDDVRVLEPTARPVTYFEALAEPRFRNDSPITPPPRLAVL